MQHDLSHKKNRTVQTVHVAALAAVETRNLSAGHVVTEKPKGKMVRFKKAAEYKKAK